MKNNNITTALHNSAKESATLIGKLFAVAQPSAVYSEPVTFDKHAHSIITASEVMVGMGFGHGGHTSASPTSDASASPVSDTSANSVNGISAGSVNGSSKEEHSDNSNRANDSDGGGGGGGGGGYSSARPVAIITIGPNGVQVKPIIDPTKIAIALFTTLASMFMVWAKMRKVSH